MIEISLLDGRKCPQRIITYDAALNLIAKKSGQKIEDVGIKADCQIDSQEEWENELFKAQKDHATTIKFQATTKNKPTLIFRDP